MTRYFTLLVAAITLATTPLIAQDAATNSSPEKSLIRINSTLQSYNFLRPWEKGAPTPRRGLGALLPGGKVVTTAEMLVNSTYIELEHPTSGAKTPAKILALDYESNLALLGPVDLETGLFDDMVPFDLTDTVASGDTLEVWQVEDNGDGVSTDVEVLRTAVNGYFVEGSAFLSYEVKGSLQYRANSFTLPVIRKGKFVGMLLSYNSKEQTSVILGSAIVKAFLTDVEDGEYSGFPSLGLAYAQTLDQQLRKFLEIEDKDGGVYVRKVAPDSSAGNSGIKVGDVVMKVKGKAIDSRGNYEDEDYGKINLSHLVRGDSKVGDVVPMEIVRDGELMTVEVTLVRKEAEDFVIDPYMFDRGPKYLIMGGLIFQELTLPYLKSWGDKWAERAPFKLIHAQAHPDQYEEEGREKLVFLSQTLRTPSTVGYENFSSIIVTEVNDKQINNIQDLFDAFLEPNEEGLHKIEFTDFPKVIYIDNKTARDVNQQLLGFGINQMARLD